MKKILVVGATGTLGRAVVTALADQHIITAARSGADVQLDIRDSASIRSAFEQIGPVDAIIATTGDLHFGPLQDTQRAQFLYGLEHKLLGQVDLALIGQHYLNPKGSITLTSGIVAHSPILGGTNASTVNAALEGFGRAAAIELTEGKRINVVCPTVVNESLEVYGPFFVGYESVAASKVAKAYVRSVFGPLTGQVFNIWQ